MDKIVLEKNCDKLAKYLNANYTHTGAAVEVYSNGSLYLSKEKKLYGKEGVKCELRLMVAKNSPAGAIFHTIQHELNNKS